MKVYLKPTTVEANPKELDEYMFEDWFKNTVDSLRELKQMSKDQYVDRVFKQDPELEYYDKRFDISDIEPNDAKDFVERSFEYFESKINSKSLNHITKAVIEMKRRNHNE